MKFMKLTVAVVFATAIAMAVVSPAMAQTTSFCEFETAVEEPCPEGHRVKHVHEVTLKGEKAKMEASGITVECDVLYLGDATTLLKAPLSIFGIYTYTNCNHKCAVTEENEISTRETLLTVAEAGSVVIKLLVRVNCGALLNCNYKAEEMIGVDWGPGGGAGEENGEVFIGNEEGFPVENGLFCLPIDLEMKTTPLVPLHLAI